MSRKNLLWNEDIQVFAFALEMCSQDSCADLFPSLFFGLSRPPFGHYKKFKCIHARQVSLNVR